MSISTTNSSNTTAGSINAANSTDLLFLSATPVSFAPAPPVCVARKKSTVLHQGNGNITRDSIETGCSTDDYGYKLELHTSKTVFRVGVLATERGTEETQNEFNTTFAECLTYTMGQAFMIHH
jgi:hypothetical protein